MGDTEEEVYEQGKQDVHKVLDQVYSNATNDLQTLQDEVESSESSETATLFAQTSHVLIKPAWVCIGLIVASSMMFAMLRLRRSASTTLKEPLLGAGLSRTSAGLSRTAVA